MIARPPPALARRLTLALAGVLAVAAAGAPAEAAGPSLRPYYERTLMGEAGRRCPLFTPAVMRSLDAGAAQARSAALGAGVDPAAVDAARGRATAKARATACDNPDLRIAAQRVRAAFLSWSRQPRLDLPGRGGGWTAERPWKKGPRWTLSTQASLAGAPVRFGLVRLDGPDQRLAVVTPWPEAPRAYAVRLVVRDGALAADPYLSRDGQPPAAASRSFLAQARGPAPKDLGPAGVLVRFPPEADDALALLDPRENVRLEFAFAGAGGDRRVSTLIPVGDFATGRAFLAAGP